MTVNPNHHAGTTKKKFRHGYFTPWVSNFFGLATVSGLTQSFQKFKELLGYFLCQHVLIVIRRCKTLVKCYFQQVWSAQIYFRTKNYHQVLEKLSVGSPFRPNLKQWWSFVLDFQPVLMLTTSIWWNVYFV